ncbi:hypothetical protein D3C84_841220 [compost metagenome]
MGLEPLEQRQRGIQILGLATVGIPSQVVQHHSQHLVGGVDDGDAAVGKFCRQFGLEQQVETAHRGIRHPLPDHGCVIGEPYGAPGVGHHRIP